MERSGLARKFRQRLNFTTMPKFKVGQKVTLRVNGKWHADAGIGEHNNYGPKFGEIVTVNHYAPDYPMFGKEWVNFDEYQKPNVLNGKPEYYSDYRFEPVISDAVLREELDSVPEPYTL